jgi:hypothetical protein
MPLPTYQQSGLLSQPTQKLDFAAERESERTSQMMAQQLDRLSEFAFKAAAKTAVREGEQWAYNNPISDEQIMAAKQGSLDIALKVPKAGTIFGDSARKIQAGQLRSTLELAARSDIASIYKQVEAGQITNIRQLDEQFYGIAKGNGDVIAKIDPEQANAFRASVATASNVVYQAAAKRIGEFNVKVIEENVSRSLSDFDDVVRASIDEQPDPKILNGIILSERNKRLDMIAQTYNPVSFADTQKNLDTRTEKAYVDRLSNYFSSDEFGQSTPENSLASKLQAVQEGNVGKYQALWKTLSTETRQKIEDQFYSSESKKEKFRQDDFSRREKLNKQESLETLYDFYQGKKTVDETINILISNGQATPAIIKSLSSGEEQSTNPNMYFFVEGQIDKGIVSKEDVEKLYNDGKLSFKDSVTFRKQIETQSKELGEAKQIIKAKLKLPDGLFVGNEYKKQQEKYSELVGELIFASNDARQAGKPFNPISFARQLAEKESGKLVTESVKKLEKDLTDAWGRANVRQPAKKDFTDDDLKILYPKMKEKDRKRIIDRQKDLEDAK